MGAVVSRFEADFTKFYEACKRSVVELAGVEGATKKVAKAADDASNSFRSDRVTANMARVRDEQTKLGATFSKTGANIRDTNELLKLMGVNTGPLGAALTNLGEAATAAGTAATVLGTAMASWKLGRVIAEVGDLDKQWTEAGANLFGYKSVAAEVALVHSEMLAKATKAAGYAITDLTTAENVNRDAAEGLIAKNIKLAESYKKVADDAVAADKIRQSNLDKDQKTTVAFVASQMETLAQLQDAARKKDADEKVRQAERVRSAEYEIQMQVEAGRARQGVALAESLAQADAYRWTLAETNALKQQAIAAHVASLERGETTQSYDLSTDAGRARFIAANPTGSLTGSADYFKTHTLAEGLAAGLVSLTGGGGLVTGGGGPVAAGVPTTRGAAGASPVVVYAPVQVSGVFDASSQAALSKSVGAGMLRGVQAGRQWP